MQMGMILFGNARRFPIMIVFTLQTAKIIMRGHLEIIA